MRKFRSVVLIMIASTALLAACDENVNGNGDLGIDPTAPSTPADATPATPPAGANGLGSTPPAGTDGTAVPDDDEADETRIEASITDSDLTVSPSSVSGDADVVLHIMNNSTTDRDVLIVRMGMDDDSSTLFGLFEDDEVIDRASLDVVGEVTVDANSETEIGTDMIGTDLEPGTYAILATTIEGDGLLWAEFTVEEDTR